MIDPFSDKCVVVTGSHNLGHKASFDNDENLAIIEGNKKLAVAYTTHVLDVYDHFAWRYQVKQKGEKRASQLLKSTPDEWLDQYFDSKRADQDCAAEILDAGNGLKRLDRLNYPPAVPPHNLSCGAQGTVRRLRCNL